MDQSALLLIITILVGLVLIAVGIYLILVLHEARKTLKRANSILNRVESTANFFESKIARPAANFGSIAMIVKDGLEFFSEIRRSLRSKSDKQNEPQ